MSGRLALPLVLALVASALGAPARGADGSGADESPNEHYTLRAELGPELDTNAHRTELINVPGTVNPPVVSSPLARAVLSGSLSDVVGDGHQVAMSATLAAKVFEKPEARDEDVGIAESTLLWRAPLGARSALALSGAYYEAFQREAPAPVFGDERRDFRSLTPNARVIGAASEHVDLGVGVGYRLFVFKPDQSFDFNGPTASVDARWARETADGVADWEAAVRAVYERRAFDGAPFVEPATCTTPCPPVPGTGARLDHFATAAVDLSRTGARLLVGAGYALHLNLSNSFGETVTRHFVDAHVAASLPLELYVALRAEIVFAFYKDHVVVAPNMAGSTFSSIEDENRNSVRVDLSRNLTERLQLIARYSFYANSSTAGNVTYRRQTALLSLAYTFEK
ncbi:MAG TPA: hypothetical protein VHL80_19080 [Polyangia bacterium]|nr:hypothetical protein [Polyangia bacterium]